MPIFSKKVDIKEEVRTAQHVNRKGVRDVDSEIRQLDAREKRLVAEIKAAAKKDPASAKVLAKSLVQLRTQREKLQQGRAHLQGLTHSLTVQKTTHTMAGVMQQTAATMGRVNAAMAPQRIAADAQQFARANAASAAAQDAIDDALDDAFEANEDEADELVAQVLDEVGIDAVTGAVSAPQRRVAAPARAQAAPTEDAELEALMAGLK